MKGNDLNVTHEVIEVLECVDDCLHETGTGHILLNNLIRKLESGEYIVIDTRELEYEPL